MPTETRASAEEEKKEDMTSSSSGDQKDTYSNKQDRPTSRQSPPSTMAINMINAAPSPSNRPPSTSSVHSAGSSSNNNGAPPPRTTAMSRRGGRTRSRSPSSMTMNRPPSTTPSEGSHQQQNAQSSSTTPSNINQPPMSPANPSAAAAAAAAAAKSLRTGNGTGSSSSHSHQYPPSSFYGGGQFDARDPSARGVYGSASSSSSLPHMSYRYGGGPPPHLRAAPGYYDPHGYSGPPPPHHQHPHHRGGAGGWPPSSATERAPSRNGPGDAAAAAAGGSSNPSGGSAAGPPPSVRGRDPDPYGYNPQGRRGPPPPPPGYGRGDPYHHHRYGGADDSGEYSRRGPPPPPPHYGNYPPYSSRGGNVGPRTPGGRTTSPHTPSSYRRGPPPPDGNSDPYGYTGRSPAKGGSDTAISQDNHKNDHGMKSTKTVIGTATPIHVPRASENPTGGLSAPPPSADSRRGSAASVFRGRPGSDGLRSKPSNPSRGGSGGSDDDEDDTSPQKILLALRTPSNSFEEKKSGRPDDNTDSPEDPPQLRNMFNEPQRSPRNGGAGPPQPTNSLDMAPSFSLFNQSFDSLGDTAGFFNVGGPLDSALQSTSFGGAASILEDKSGLGMGELQLTASNGTFKLNPSSSGGALTFGMSPTNSFGNGPTSSFSTRGGNITLLGNDHRAASPSVLELGFRSGASPRANPSSSMDETNLRLSASMGSPTFSRQYVGDSGHLAPPVPYHHPAPHQPYGNPYQMSAYPTHRPYRASSTPAPDGAPNFYIFLRRHKEAFREVTFLLPGLRNYMDSKQEDNEETPKRQGRDRRSWAEPNQQEIEISQRRIASAICAFGGTFIGSRMNNNSNNSAKSKTASIFREKSSDSATVTPSSNYDGPKVSRRRAKYDDALPGRYYENDNRLSWEFEEKPPIGDANDSDDEDEYDANGNRRSKKGGGSKNGDGKKDKSGGDDDDDDDDDGSGEENEDGSKKTGDGKSKIKYRCKLCGQPKQNHSCPYQQSLARSIGVMVYPAVNAFTSDEPGVLAPALSEMNNFIGAGGDSVSSDQGSPSRPTPDRMRLLNASGSLVGTSTAQVTPESLRGTPRGVTSPAPYSTPQRQGVRSSATPGSVVSSSRKSIPSSVRSKKRSHAQLNGEVGTQDDLLFVEPMDLKPEQFRMVTPSKAMNHPDAFTYPALPLPYAQRKRLSDNLFSLSKEVPQLTDECAAVLREARERDLWDLAVAELMTQVVVVVHCHDGDMCFEGLRRYLLTLGISS